MARKFKAEVQQLLNLMVHSVYSDQDVFLRELVSNAADALDKVRFLELTHDSLTAIAGEEPGIRIVLDADAHTLTIEDDGIGLTEQEAIDNLGTIAHSGTGAFLEKLESGDTKEGLPELIGQFGVGFYSSFMVAKRVTVHSRSALPDATPITWQSDGEGTYTIKAGSREARGTEVVLELRDDAWETFSELPHVRQVVQKHSNFLTWPILVDGEQANAGKALWRERPASVTDDEANAFYKSVSVDWRDPARKVHVSVDSPIQYSALLFIPSERPYDLFDPTAARGPRLYAKRVLILEHAKELLPEWLRFVRGVVDSEDISLNLSREMIQKTAVVRKIRDALTKRILKDLGKWAAEAPAEDADAEAPSYAAFWRNFGALIKEGYYHDALKWGEQLRGLLRFNATSHDDDQGLMSLEDYTAAMPDDQDTVWYLAGPSRSSCLASPHLEAVRAKGWDVLLLTDTVDEWLVSSLTEVDGKPIKSLARGELELDDDVEAESADVTELSPWLGELLAERVAEVRPSTRLTDSACVLVDADQGMSANLERILRAANQDSGMVSKRVLEINPKHPLIRDLAKLQKAGKTDVATPLAELLYDDALLLEGTVTDPSAMGRRLQNLLARAASDAATQL